MTYKAFYRSEIIPERISGICYSVFEDDGSYYIECEICGGKYSEKIFIGNCGEEKAKKIAKFLAANSVHPVHVEDIISDKNILYVNKTESKS